jgi:peptide chain release factor 1
MIPAMEAKVVRFHEIEKLLEDPAIVTVQSKYTPLVKELGTLTKMVKPYQELLQLEANVAATQAMLESETDEEMRAMAQEELDGLTPKLAALREKVED